jgi:pyrimidine/purine-5'-nucleotide nucleosidase
VALPLVFTGPASSRSYFERLHAFIGQTLGPRAQSCYKILLADPTAVAQEIATGLNLVREARAETADPFFFNWQLDIGLDYQIPFEATHESMASLELHRDQDLGSLAVNLRRAFSGIVAGNVREAGIRLVEEHGPFELRGERSVTSALDRLLNDFVAQQRMKLSDPASYVPCYRIVD